MNDQCRAEGGSWEHLDAAVQICGYSEAFPQYQQRGESGTDLGFRCCAD